MALLKVNTETIAATAAAIRTGDEGLSSGVEQLRTMCTNLLGSWESSAGSAAQSGLLEILQGDVARSAVLQNYAAMLSEVVNPGAETAENTNTKLADLFK